MMPPVPRETMLAPKACDDASHAILCAKVGEAMQCIDRAGDQNKVHAAARKFFCKGRTQSGTGDHRSRTVVCLNRQQSSLEACSSFVARSHRTPRSHAQPANPREAQDEPDINNLGKKAVAAMA